ncbi:Protein spinster [Camellia lanceoleosa]|uniref:Protein spinster n=1 Tax=Camellia lanceoleosa TaxID=1840588 RepID=A0ACC0J029_9ERIC|nr:Protein spinster [Camellia lanceoleosa]
MVMMMKSETLTLLLVNLAGIMERADESLLPGVYKEVGAALHTDPTGLGSLTLFRSIVQSACYPLAAYLAARHNRAHVIALGAFLWAAATFLVAISSTFFEVAVSRGLNGIGLAIVTPAILSLVADSTDETNRGMAFGWLQLAGNFGSIIGGLCSVLIASTSFMGIAGWRIAFHLVGLISVIVGVLVRLFANDPRFSDSNAKAQIPNKPFWSEMKDLVKEAKSVMKISSFQIIVAQGVAGSFPWSALSFAPMWLELIGFSHKTVAILWTLFVMAGSLGGLFGGKMGDILGQRFPNSGRIILSQISSVSAIPLAAILLLVLPDDPSTAFMHGLIMFIMGLSISWNGPATNSPIFAEIVPERSRTTIYALDRSFESILSSFAPPVVGILAQHVFGYKPIQKGSTDSEEIETDRENAAPLAKALYSAIGIPFVICCLFYSFLYYTYPRDRERARMHALIESEMQPIENPPSEQEYSQLHVSGLDELQRKERSVIQMYYEGEESLNVDENDEKRLLSCELPLSDNGKS